MNDERVQYVVAHYAEPHSFLVSTTGTRSMEPGWYFIEQGGEPCRQNNGDVTPPAARFYGPFQSPLDGLNDAVARLS